MAWTCRSSLAINLSELLNEFRPCRDVAELFEVFSEIGVIALHWVRRINSLEAREAAVQPQRFQVVVLVSEHRVGFLLFVGFTQKRDRVGGQ